MSKNSDDSGIGMIEDRLDDIDDFDDFYDIMDEFGLNINLSGLDDLDATKERMREYIFKMEVGNFKQLISRSMESKAREDKHKRERITSVLENFKSTMTKYRSQIQLNGDEEAGYNDINQRLTDEGTLTDFDAEVDERIKMASENGCPLVIAGETNAGKSTLINLLLGENVLPTFGGSCTSVITRISYGKTMKVEIRCRDGASITYDNLSQVKLENEVWPKIYVKENVLKENEHCTTREILSSIYEIRFELPSRILKCGLVLIDSPGIGENEAMDSVVANYVKEQCVMGYIYIIKSDNAGGVDEDRLLSLIQFVLDSHESKDRGMCLPFNSKSAIFLCNRWDAIKADERDAVFNNAFTTLKGYWPDLDVEQVTTISASAVLLESSIDPDFVPEMYRAFLEHLRDLYINAVDNRMDWIYEWSNRVIRRTQHHLDQVKKKSSHTQSNLQNDAECTRIRLNLLRDHAQPFLKKTLQDLGKHTVELQIRLRKYLQANYTKQRLTHWDEYDFSEAENQANEDSSNGQHRMSVIKKHIDDKIDERLTDAIVEWEEQNQHISLIQQNILESVKTELQLYDEDVWDIRNVVGCADLRVLTKGKFTESFEGRLSPTKKIGALKTFKNIFKDKKETHDTNNLVLEAEKRTLKFLKKLLENDNQTLTKILANIMDSFCVQLKKLFYSIPTLTTTREQSLAHRESCIEDLAMRSVNVDSMASDISLHMLALRDFNRGFIDIATFISEDIELKEEKWLSRSSSRKSRSFRSSDLLKSNSTRKKVRTASYGIWTALQPVQLKAHTGIEKRRDATIRVYLPSSGVNVNYREVSRIRQLQRHSCIASFEGIHYSDSPPPVVIYADTLQPLVKRRERLQSQFNVEVPQIIRDVASGLSFLHSSWLVHMELTPKTVTLTATGSVKLTGGCLPRCANLPCSTEVIAESFVCLPPVVLKGQRYNKASDVYSLGLLVFDLTTGVKPFSHQSNFQLSKFIETVDPLQMIQEDSAFSKLSTDIQNFIGTCVTVSNQRSSTMKDLAETLADTEIIPITAL